MILSWDVCPDLVITITEVFCSGMTSFCWNQEMAGSGLPITLQEKLTVLVPSSTDWLDGPEMTAGRTSVGPMVTRGNSVKYLNCDPIWRICPEILLEYVCN